MLLLFLLPRTISSNEPWLKLTIGLMCTGLTMVHISNHTQVLKKFIQFYLKKHNFFTSSGYLNKIFEICPTFLNDSEYFINTQFIVSSHSIQYTTFSEFAVLDFHIKMGKTTFDIKVHKAQS